jgi:hypothetical protein
VIRDSIRAGLAGISHRGKHQPIEGKRKTQDAGTRRRRYGTFGRDAPGNVLATIVNRIELSPTRRPPGVAS